MTDRAPSNWGRWGRDDERGAANLLDAQTVLRATKVPTRGRVYNLGIQVSRDAPVVGRRMSPLHLMSVDAGDYAALGRDDYGSNDDYLFLACHGTTHIDALSHVWYDGRLYNDFDYREVRSSGAGRCAIDKTGGMVTTAHLLDFVDRSTEEPGQIRAADLEALVAERNVDVHPGDALLLRTGWMDATLAGDSGGREFPALAVDAVRWIAEHDISIVGADNEAIEHLKTEPLKVHHALLRDLGVYILELLTLREPAEDGVTSGLFIVAPLLISRGVGSPINPLLVV